MIDKCNHTSAVLCLGCKQKNELYELKDKHNRKYAEKIVALKMQLKEANEALINLYNVNKFPDKEASLVYIQARNYIEKL